MAYNGGKQKICEKAVLPLESIDSSSHDFNQTVHRTLDERNKDTFWSSAGSKTSQASEWLYYRIAGEEPAWITHVSFSIFRARFQQNDPLYGPEKVRFSFGILEGVFHHTTPLYSVRSTDELQTFAVLPEVVLAKYVKVHFIGKPQM